MKEFLKTSVSLNPKQKHLQSMLSVNTLSQLFLSSRQKNSFPSSVFLPLVCLLSMESGHRGGEWGHLATGFSSKSPGNGSDFIRGYWSDLVLATLNCTASYIVANLTCPFFQLWDCTVNFCCYHQG